MSINLKDIVKSQVGVQAQTQAAGTPNEAGIGGFLQRKNQLGNHLPAIHSEFLDTHAE